MTRRLWLCAVVLSLIAMPALAARRRAITPGGPGHCLTLTLAPSSYAQLLAVDEQFVYMVDELGSLTRIPKLGGEQELLVFSLDEWLPLSMTVDATTIYIGVLPFEAIFSKMPGAILTVPKTGGVAGVLVSGVATPFAIATDATHLYWAAAGTFDIVGQSIDSDGKIERIKKDGSDRQALAEDLSGPLGLALDANNVFYGETGIATDDPTHGLFRVAKNGGTIATLADDVVAAGMALDGNTIVFIGATETAAGVLAIDKEGATPARPLYSTESIGVTVRIADRRAYVMQEGEEGWELAWVSIDAPNGPVVVAEELDATDDFVLDGCAAIVNTRAGALIRTPR